MLEVLRATKQRFRKLKKKNIEENLDILSKEELTSMIQELEDSQRSESEDEQSGRTDEENFGDDEF